MRLISAFACLYLLAMLSACACLFPAAKEKKSDDAFYLNPAPLERLPGWRDDGTAAALPALARSCARILKKNADVSFGPVPFAGTYADWQEVCKTLPENGSDAEARAYFKDNFRAYEVRGAGNGDGAGDGLFTGYYEPFLRGSLEKKDGYAFPLHARPSDLVTADLGAFRESLKGETITGRVAGDKFVPYFTRGEIEKGALEGQEKIVWVDDAVDAFFLHIQGSGQVRMDTGEVLRVGYAAANGRAYYAIGKALIDRGALAKENVSMQSIRAWLEQNPEEAAEVMNLNTSYVFFRKLEGDGPLGAEGVPLTPLRSLAVDRRKFPYGAPFWIDAEAPDKSGPRLRRLMVAQDTGGAIRGAVRGDFFWGAGDDAAHNAGIMKSAGKFYILLPKSVEIPEKYRFSRFRRGGDAARGFVYND